MMDLAVSQSLVCRVGTRLCAIPLTHVIEIMRPLPIEAFSGPPSFVAGLSIVRGKPVPVVDVARLLGDTQTSAGRFVTLRAQDRCVGLAVEGVLGVFALKDVAIGDLPPLLRDAGAEAISAMGVLDEELLLVLSHARIVPEGLLEALDTNSKPRQQETRQSVADLPKKKNPKGGKELV